MIKWGKTTTHSKLLMYLFEDKSTYSQKYEGGWLQLLVA